MGCGNSKIIENPNKKTDFNIKITSDMLLNGRIEDYELKDIIGTGRKSEIRIGIHRISQELRAIKLYKIKELSPKEREKMKEEITLNSLLDHPNIVHCYDIFSDDTYQYIVMELCAGGELFDRILTRDTPFSEIKVANLIKQVLLALNYCHSQNIMHRDLKPSNVLFTDVSEESQIKILNFSFSKTYHQQTTKLSFQKNDINYHLSPEALLLQTEKKSDIWSCGVLLYFLMFGKPPFNEKTQKLDEIQFPEEISSDLKAFLQKLLSKEIQKRYSAEEALQDPWMKKIENKGVSFEVSNGVLKAFKENYVYK